MAFFGSKQDTRRPGTPARPAASVSSDRPWLLNLGWLGLKAADTVAEARFLENVLKLKFVGEVTTADGHMVRYRAGQLELELVAGGATWATRPKPRHGQPDISLIPSLQFNHLNDFVNNLQEHDVPETRLFEQGWGASVLFFDPERNLWQGNEIRVEPAVMSDNLPGIGALWLSVEDFTAQVAFYRDILGLEEINEGDYHPPITEAAEHYHAQHPVINPATAGEEVTGSGPALPTGAVFRAGNIRLALSPGGQRLEDNRERVWGQDTAFLPGFQTNDLNDFARRLNKAGIQTTGPHPFYYVNQTPRGPQWRRGAALRFCDPEGHPLQVYE
jgi:catechol 2,3-dioxygenase-like lactoylglutathione lyase family enzyme